MGIGCSLRTVKRVTHGPGKRLVRLAVTDTAADVYGPAEDAPKEISSALPDVIAPEETGEVDELPLDE